MIDAESSDAPPDAGQVTPQAGPAITPRPRVTGLEGLMRFAVVVIGMLLGAILALFIGLVTGWIEFKC